MSSTWRTERLDSESFEAFDTQFVCRVIKNSLPYSTDSAQTGHARKDHP
jgi:hypothetical protein